ncbi:MAG: hypothetical protein H7257_09535 [Taibaiella sp.]|nr:hypothetical protein [Taibaiella sp.]
MAILRFRVYWEEDDLTYRDIEIQGNQTYLDFHKIILLAYEFDGKHSASFYESTDKWIYGRELNSEVLVNKKDAPALSMGRTPVAALVSIPGQKFIYVYDPVKKWTFHIELISVTKDETYKRVYPFVLRKEGVAPAQYGVKGVNPNKLMEIEEKYDLGAEEMAEGFGDEGDGDSDSDSSNEGADEQGAEDANQDF